MRYTMMQVCKETGMTYQALKFYCNEGLVPNVKRDKNNRRVFDERDVAWISSLTRLKKCGMSIQEMKDYLALCLQGERTIPQRKILLRRSRRRCAQAFGNCRTASPTSTGSRIFTTKCSPASGRMRAILFGWKNRRKAGVSIKSRRRTARYRLLLAFLPYFIPAPRRAPSSG